jgi:hypothetical protein
MRAHGPAYADRSETSGVENLGRSREADQVKLAWMVARLARYGLRFAFAKTVDGHFDIERIHDGGKETNRRSALIILDNR